MRIDHVLNHVLVLTQVSAQLTQGTCAMLNLLGLEVL